MDGNFDIIWNYCGQNYKFKSEGWYGTFRRHLINKHPTQIGVEQRQIQIFGYTISSFSSHLFKNSDKQNK